MFAFCIYSRHTDYDCCNPQTKECAYMKKKRVVPTHTERPGKIYDGGKEKENNVIGRRIAEARKKKGFSIASFSSYLGNYGIKISAGGAGKWETGDSIPNAYQFISICTALDLENDIPFFMSEYAQNLNEEGKKKVEEYRADLVASGKYRPIPKLTSIISYKKMPVSDLRVSAGTGAFLDEGSYEMIDFPADKVPDGADF